MRVEATTLLVPYRGDPLAVLIDTLFTAVSPPDFSAATVLLVNGSAAADLRRQLLTAAHARGHAAIRPPFIGTLPQWLDTYAPASAPSDYAMELILHRALRETPNPAGNRWAFIANIRTLLQELDTFAGEELTATPLDAPLARAYGVRRLPFAPLTREARYVADLRSAWQGFVDAQPNGAYRARLDHAAAATVGPIYLVGFTALAPTEAAWLTALGARATQVLHGRCTRAHSTHPDAVLQPRCAAATPVKTAPEAFTEFLHTAYADDDTPLAARACEQRARATESPARGRLEIYSAAGLEGEAHAVALQVRRWWLAGSRRIGIVTHDRVLARRVRALLERAGIDVRDAAGWPLSTTSAASVIVRWLDTLASDFTHDALADVLTSPFAFTDRALAERREWVAWWRRELAARAGSVRGLGAGEMVLQRSAHAFAAPLRDLFARVRAAAAPFAAAGRAGMAQAWFTALQASLASLGTHTAFAADAAGSALAELLAELHAAAARHDTRLDAGEFRAFLEHNFERHYFYPPAPSASVELLGFAQSRLRRFDALALVGLSARAFPQAAAATPFFNDRVRGQFDLPTAARAQQEQLYDYRRLLEAAPNVLLTHRREAGGQPLRPSVWVEQLQFFHQAAYGDDLSARELSVLAAHPQTVLAQRDAPLPSAPQLPSPALPPALIPTHITPSSYQDLLDCPYKFFARAVLGLRPIDAASETMEKPDYGRAVHRILEAFHHGHAELPGPFAVAITPANAAAAAECLRTIARAAFAPWMERRFFANAWLHRFLALVPKYIEWEMARSERWRPHAGERALTWRDAEVDVTLKGRLDRIDTGVDGIAIVDYKTSKVASQADLAAGESVQLPLYALLAAQIGLPIAEAVLLQLDDRKVTAPRRLEGPELDALANAMALRLRAIWSLLAQGAPLPAWGDDVSCTHCEVSAICRKPFWPPAAAPPR